MKSKGFTLIELLAVIVILAVIALIATPIILGIINDTKRQAFEIEAGNIEKAAEYYLTTGLKIEEVPKYEEYYIPVSDLTNYLNNVKDEMLDKSVIVKKADNNISYYYTGRDKNPYIGSKTLKELVESDSSHILTNKKVNGVTVNKVIGTKAEKNDIKNWVWYSGQLWQVLETHEDYVKLMAANSVTSISYGTNSTWSTSWVRKWLNEIDSNSNQDGIYYNNLSRTDLILEGKFCLDEPTGLTEADFTIGGQTRKKVTAFTPINTCSNVVTDKVGLMTFEDYVYSLDGNGINGALGGSYIDESRFSWTMTKYTVAGATNRMWLIYYLNPSHIEHAYGDTEWLSITVRPVIYLNSNIKIQNNTDNQYGTIYNPYQLVGEQILGENDNLNQVTIGSYIYLSEVNNPYPTYDEYVGELMYEYSPNSVRYRVIGINSDGTIKIERTDVLLALPANLSTNDYSTIPFYYKSNTCDATAGIYTGCNNHNYFNPTEGTGTYNYADGENIAYFLNNANNSYYNWFSNEVKNNIVLTNWNLSTAAEETDYTTSLFNTNYTGTYPTRTNDGTVAAYIGLPQRGDMFSGNDTKFWSSYWYINRRKNSVNQVMFLEDIGSSYSYYTSTNWISLRPVLNLKSTLKIVSGDGTPNNPYTLNI